MHNSLPQFEAHRFFRGGVIQTVLGAKFPGNTKLPQRKTHKVRVGENSVLVVLELESRDPSRPVVLLAHGMGGCSESGYMRRIARKLWDHGFGVFMMNHRGSGPGMGMSDTLWHGGSSDDLDRVARFILEQYPDRPLLAIGFSLSGNILLKYLGEGRALSPNIRAAFAVNPPIDLKVSSRILSGTECPDFFNQYFLRLIRNQVAALVREYPSARRPWDEFRSIWEFDEVYTAPAGGFRNVHDYYDRCSSRQFLRNIRLPTCLLCSRDDPFIPPKVFESVIFNPVIQYHSPDHGGHMGYLSHRPTPLGDHRWLDYVLVQWAQIHC